MVTQLPIYNGNNNHNNSIIVDYRKKKVEFKPVVSNGCMKTDTSLNTPLQHLSILFLKILMIIWIFVFIVYDNRILAIKTLMALTLMWAFCIIIIIPFISHIFSKIDKKHKYYPIINYKLELIYDFFSTKETSDIDVVIKPEMMRDNKVHIKKFKNVCLDYEATGEFKKYLIRVEIKPIEIFDPTNWEAIFIFSRTPKKGELRLRYL